VSKPPDTADNDYIEIRVDSAGEFRWHRVAGNYEVISQGEGYVTHAGALEGARRANPDVPADRIESVEGRP
jgi:uncharacterized protein YegP (UPF0339 family)